MTQGCRWQEKSFSVPMVHRVLDTCSDCHLPIENAVYKINGEPYCKVCFGKKPSLRQRLGITDFNFNTTKDKLFDFVDNKNFRKPVEIRSKGQWKRELKKHGLTDDVDFKKPNELKQQYDTPKISKEFIKDEILKELQEKGLRDKLIRRG